MSTVELQSSGNSRDEDWIDMPLFGENILFKVGDNTNPQNADGRTGEPAISVTNKILSNDLPVNAEILNSDIPCIPATENVASHLFGNVVLPIEQVTNRGGLEKAVRVKKSRKKKAPKKIKSEKRDVIAMKFFGTREEKMHLEAIAKDGSQSFSNFVRLHLGLHPNQPGRKKQMTQAAFDLDLDELLAD